MDKQADTEYRNEISPQDIIEMARQAGEFKDDAFPEPWIPFFVKFAKLVADVATAKEREACAKLFPQPHMEYFGQNIQDAIRARGEEV